jgi:hypothetical protein
MSVKMLSQNSSWSLSEQKKKILILQGVFRKKDVFFEQLLEKKKLNRGKLNIANFIMG